MREKLKAAFNFYSKLIETIISALSVILFSRKFISKPKGSRPAAIILGTGPSLTFDLSSIEEVIKNQKTDIWAVNSFVLSDHYSRLRPSNYVFADPAYWSIDAPPEMERYKISVLNSFLKKTEWDVIVHLPFDAMSSNFICSLKSKHIKINFYNRTAVNGFKKFQNFIYSLGLGMPPPFNVLIATLTLCINFNYRRIYLYGADHSWHEDTKLDDENHILISQTSFYFQNILPQRVNKVSEKIYFSNAELFKRWGEIFHQYEILDDYATNKKVIIINKSNKSYIDAFRKYD